jgi:hypothetical protein
MLNVNQLTSTLAKLSDQALQQYAAMHKEDPYVMSLAVAESNRRKEMRNAVQGAQGGEQPKVADQMLAGMAPAQEALPEDQGIARLPTGDMNFAGGGIVAFADGGDVERYQVGGMMAPSAVTPYAIPGMTIPATSRFPMPTGTPGEETIQRAIDAADSQSRRYTGLPLSDAQKQKIRASFDRDFSTAARMAPPAAPTSATPAAPAQSAPATPAAPATTRPDAPRADAPRADMAGERAPAGAGVAAAPRAGGFDMSPQGLMKLRETLGKETQVKEPDDIREAREALSREEVAAAEARKAGLEASQAKFADAFKGREERISKREADLEKRGNQNMGLALLQAGAAMMSTPGGLAMALGKGVRVGTEQYAAGLDNLRSAREKLDEARDRMDDLKLNRDMMNDKEIRDAEAGIRTAQIEGRKRGVAALADMFQVSNKRADSMFDKVADAGMTMYREQQANARNAASVASNRLPAEARMAMLLGTGKTEAERLETGTRKLQELQSDKSGMGLVKTLAETNAKREAAGQPPMTMQDLLGSLREYQALMYPKVGDVAPTRARPQ